MPSLPSRPRNVAFLLAQVGVDVSRRFAERIRPLGISSSDAACLRIIAARGPLNQRGLAQLMGIVPSRVVSLVDGLEAAGLVERRTSSQDRRSREIVLTARGNETFAELRGVAAEHEAEFLDGLEEADVEALSRALRRIADRRGLPVGGPPGG